MICYEFDGTANGLLCCIFESFLKNEKPVSVTTGETQLSFYMQLKVIATEIDKAERVRKGINKISVSLLPKVFFIFRSGDRLKATIMFNILYKCIKDNRDITKNFADADVVIFNELFQKITYESHRLKGFIRFEESIDGIWYSHFEPDNDVIDIIAPHFKARFMLEKFILHDTKHNLIRIYDGKKLYKVTTNSPLCVYLSPKETEMKKLWITYYDSINIASRKNIRQMKLYMPLRYQRNCIEKTAFRSPLFTSNDI